MPMKRRHAEIAGAGFAGLAAATALCQRGWTARVHEKAPEARAFGAGIFIWDNGLRVLKVLGAYDAVLKGAFAAPAYETRSDGKLTSYEAINGTNRYRLLTMSRQHLHDAMLKAALAAGVDLVTSSEAVGATPEGELLLAGGKRLKADVVVGAEGVRSAVRDSLGIQQERYRCKDGIIRVLTDRGPLKGGQWDHVIDMWCHSPRVLRILYTPSGEDLLYMAMMAPLADPQASKVPVDPEPWVECFPDLEPVLRGLADRGRYDVYETTRLECWHRGRVALVGDSAHAMPPTLAQGAGCAIMNALALAVALDEGGSVEEVLPRWERRERPLTDHTQSRAKQIADSRSLAGGMSWDDDGLRAARHVPTGTPADDPAFRSAAGPSA